MPQDRQANVNKRGESQSSEQINKSRGSGAVTRSPSDDLKRASSEASAKMSPSTEMASDSRRDSRPADLI